MATLLADENFPLPVIHSLRALGRDVNTLRDYGQSRRWPVNYCALIDDPFCD